MADELQGAAAEGEEIAEVEPYNPYPDMSDEQLIAKFRARIERLDAKGQDVRQEYALLALLEATGKRKKPKGGLAKAAAEEVAREPDLGALGEAVDPKDETQDAPAPKKKH